MILQARLILIEYLCGPLTDRRSKSKTIVNRTPGYNIGKFARTIVLAIVCVLLSLSARAGAVMPSAMRVEIEAADGIGKSSDSISVKILEFNL